MQAYHAQTRYQGEAERQVVVRSVRCSYSVWIQESEGEITISGPGVEESASIDSFPFLDSPEDLAILSIIHFENGCWPEE